MAKPDKVGEALKYGLPELFVKRLQDLVPTSSWESVLASFSEPRLCGARINTCRAEPSAIFTQLTAAGFHWQPVAGSPTAFWVPAGQRELLTHSDLVNSGAIYVQSLSSQLAAVVLAPRPGQAVLDLAAAPGGKTSHLAALLQGQGQLSAVEAVKPRFFRMLDNFKRLNVTGVRTFLADGRSVGRKVGERFDRVLLDAPCSSESRFRAGDPDSYATWSLRKIKDCARKQSGLIRSAFESLKPGGHLLYATCSFAPEENEAIVQGLLDAFPDQTEVLPIPDLPCSIQGGLDSFGKLKFSSELSATVRVLPDTGYSGFYLALLGKSGNSARISSRFK